MREEGRQIKKQRVANGVAQISHESSLHVLVKLNALKTANHSLIEPESASKTSSDSPQVTPPAVTILTYGVGIQYFYSFTILQCSFEVLVEYCTFY